MSTTVQDTESASTIRKKKESLLSLEHHMNKWLVIEQSNSGRMIRGILKGFDSNMNLILMNTVIVHEDAPNAFAKVLDVKDVVRELGACVLRGGVVGAIYSLEGTQIASSSNNNDPLAGDQ
jgi:small nuclear ribonucleoprotein (snRNP)-like protein